MACTKPDALLDWLTLDRGSSARQAELSQVPALLGESPEEKVKQVGWKRLPAGPSPLRKAWRVEVGRMAGKPCWLVTVSSNPEPFSPEVSVDPLGHLPASKQHFREDRDLLTKSVLATDQKVCSSRQGTFCSGPNHSPCPKLGLSICPALQGNSLTLIPSQPPTPARLHFPSSLLESHLHLPEAHSVLPEALGPLPSNFPYFENTAGNPLNPSPYFLFVLYAWTSCLCVHLTPCAWPVLQRSEENIGSRGTGIIDSCELP